MSADSFTITIDVDKVRPEPDSLNFHWEIKYSVALGDDHFDYTHRMNGTEAVNLREPLDLRWVVCNRFELFTRVTADMLNQAAEAGL